MSGKDCHWEAGLLLYFSRCSGYLALQHDATFMLFLVARNLIFGRGEFRATSKSPSTFGIHQATP